MQSKLLKNGCVALAVSMIGLYSSQAYAQTAPIFGGPSPLSGMGGISSLFGGGRATARNQGIQYALDKAHQAKEIAEEIKQTTSLIKSLDPRQIQSMLSEVAGIEEFFDQNVRQMQEIYNDPTGNDSLEESVAFKKIQMQRELDRLDKIAKETERAAERDRVITRATEAAVTNSRSGGVLSALQANVDVTAAQTKAIQDGNAINQQMIILQSSELAQKAEDEQIARERACKFFGDQESFTSVHCR